jgi:Bacterial PH domain
MYPSGAGPEHADAHAVELHPTPESRRIALLTAAGSFGIAVVATIVAVIVRASVPLLVASIVVVLAALATFVPAVGALSATVDADTRGVTIRRLGRASRFAWREIAGVRVIERRASVPDGTEYHWVAPSRAGHVVAVPCLELSDGRVRQLPALAAPATGARSAVAYRCAEELAHLCPTATP